MATLKDRGIVIGKDTKAATVFEGLLGDFNLVKYSSPSDYVNLYWRAYKNYCEGKKTSIGVNGRILEYILATLFIREKMLPLYLGAKVAFVPNVIYDLMLYTEERGPVCISSKTSLRERYKQADLEAIALKYVHRKSLCYLITLEKKEAASVKEKIKTGDVIGLDDVIVANEPEFDILIKNLKKFVYSEAKTIDIIKASLIIK